MYELNDKNYINKAEIVMAQKINGEYIITLTSGVMFKVTEEQYNEIIGE